MSIRPVLAIPCALLAALLGCQSQTTAGAEPNPIAKPETLTLDGVDTSSLTVREKEQWSSYVGELLAPCPDQPVSIAQCVTEKRSCSTCKPAAEFLVKQVTRGRTRAQAEEAFRIRFSPDEVKTIDVDGSPVKGSVDAKVTIVEWADFECPFCGIASPMLDQAIGKFPGQVQLVFKHFPLSSHEHAEMAARAAVAADRQGKFWQMHHALFKSQGHLDEASIERLARDIGLDEKQFGVDRKGEAAADRVTADKKQAEELGLRGTPMIYVNGRYFDLEKFDLAEDLDDWIELEIELSSGAPRPSGAGTGSAASGSATAAMGSAASGSAASGSAAPGSAAPGSAAPGSAAPSSAASGSLGAPRPLDIQPASSK
jgi:2-hydroxychromene-2-carboxylate isomerase